jgi:hypothetical protein
MVWLAIVGRYREVARKRFFANALPDPGLK